MSGICGIFNLEGRPVEDDELAAITAMMKRRGPDAARHWRNREVGLGHALLATTPELQFEQQPFIHSETGCVVTADVRLDNRDELIAALDVRGDTVGDAELIVSAYLKWGAECPKRLLGDFAFSVWDPRQQELFCARDHSGMRQLYYHFTPGKRFLFATDARAILVVTEVPYRLNRGRIADFLVSELEWIDYTSSFFEDVFRLPPGHCATVTRSGLAMSEYWRPLPMPMGGKISDEEYREGFLEVFTRAVDARLRVPADSVGSMLSGGMDSGTVVAVAREMRAARDLAPLPTYSCTLRQDRFHPDFDEVRSIAAATSMTAIAPTIILPESLQDDVEAMISGNEEPFDGECMMLKAIFHAAATDNRRVILDGVAGDVVLGHGSYIIRLIRSGRLRRAFEEIVGECQYWKLDSCATHLYRRLRSAVAPAFVKRFKRQSAASKAKNLVGNSLISEAFAEQVQLEDRVRRNRLMFPGTWTRDYALERSNSIRPNLTAGQERYARLAATVSVEACDPFMDRRVVDYCSALPGRFRLRDGRPKAILRDLMAGKLPEEVLRARGKHHVGWVFNASITASAVRQDRVSAEALQSSLEEYVSPTKIAEAWQQFLDGENTNQLHKAYVLSTWLRENERRPVVTI